MIDLQSLAAPGNARLDASSAEQAALAPARKRFVDLIVQRILAFESFRQAVERGDNAQTALIEIANLAHKISGTAATLGFPKAGKLAGALEVAIHSGRAQRHEPAAILASVEAHLDGLLDVLETLLDK